MTVLRSFSDFPAEAILIGRMVVGYTDLEIDLMNCVKSARQDLDTVFKSMFRARGETQRIDIADAIGRQTYRELNLGTQFEMAIGAQRHCLKIRNQYAHSAWWNDNSGRLAFANLEDLAKVNDRVEDLHGLNVRHVEIDLLQEQFAYFEHTSDLLIWVLQEGNRLAGRPHHPGVPRPRVHQSQPALYRD